MGAIWAIAAIGASNNNVESFRTSGLRGAFRIPFRGTALSREPAGKAVGPLAKTGRGSQIRSPIFGRPTPGAAGMAAAIRPGMHRDRILSEGPGALADAELLSILLAPRDELLPHRLLSRGLSGLSRATAGELLFTSGMGSVQAIRLLAAIELG